MARAASNVIAMPQRKLWAPQFGSQLDFVTCPIFEALYEGTRGPGKTNALLYDFAQHCGRGYGAHWRGILFRQTYKQLSDVITKCKEWYYPSFPGIKFNASDFVWKWPTGEELLLRHFATPDDYWNYHGHEYPWIGWEELTNWPSMECYESMKSCSRSSNPGMPRKYRANCNPYGVGHNAVKGYFIDPMPAGVVYKDPVTGLERVRIHGNVEENDILLQADPEYIAKLDSITNENKKKAWRYGDWDIVAGGIFDDVWEPRIHVLSGWQPRHIPSSWRIDRSFDWGSSAPFSVGWWARSDGSTIKLPDGTERTFPRGTLFRIGEWYGWNGKANEGVRMLSSNIAKGILEREAAMGIAGRVRVGPADASIFDTVEGKTIANEMGLVGVPWEPSMKNPGSRKIGWERIREMMQASIDNEGPGLYIFDSCRDGFLRTVPVLPRDEANPDDIDKRAEDHAADEVRYRVLHIERIAHQTDMY